MLKLRRRGKTLALLLVTQRLFELSRMSQLVVQRFQRTYFYC